MKVFVQNYCLATFIARRLYSKKNRSGINVESSYQYTEYNLKSKTYGYITVFIIDGKIRRLHKEFLFKAVLSTEVNTS